MKKETQTLKWHFRLIQAIFWIAFAFLIILGIWAVFYEDDMPFIGFFWAIALAIAYWVIKRIFYHK